eukprot:1142863-Amphidinium_carterae.2
MEECIECRCCWLGGVCSGAEGCVGPLSVQSMEVASQLVVEYACLESSGLYYHASLTFVVSPCIRVDGCLAKEVLCSHIALERWLTEGPEESVVAHVASNGPAIDLLLVSMFFHDKRVDADEDCC